MTNYKIFFLQLRETAVITVGDERLSRIEDMLIQLIQMQAANNAKIEEMMSDIKEIKDGQDRQDRILEMLSVKSIETESYIRDFKRR